MKKSDFYALNAATPQGKLVNFSDFKGKVVMIVNTATKCGLAGQFDGLEALHQHYKEKGLIILGFPSDQFMNQEPESNDSMEEACRINHGVTFQLTQKCDVNGKNTHEVFQFLKSELSGFLGSKIKWNFTKFLIDKNGQPFKRYSPTTKPLTIQKDIERLLAN